MVPCQDDRYEASVRMSDRAAFLPIADSQAQSGTRRAAAHSEWRSRKPER